VRLADGRVGRVQTVVDPGLSADSQDHGNDQEVVSQEASSSSVQSTNSPLARDRESPWSRRQDRRHREDQELPLRQIGLDAYMTQSKPRRSRKGKVAREFAAIPGDQGPPRADESDYGTRDGQRALSSSSPSATVTCPVCGEFEGDEAATTHHVASHFGS
jgi:hypothetical protein